MLRILKQFILTTLFVIFASQASAMFIQPDWLDPTQPGVGTNRYSYSFNDPINKLDPNGNEAIESWDGPDPSEGDKLDEELSYVNDVVNDPTLSTEEKIEYVRDLYNRVNTYNLGQPPLENQAIGLGGLAQAMHNLQNAPEAATGAQPTAQGVTTVSVGPRATNTPRAAVNAIAPKPGAAGGPGAGKAFPRSTQDQARQQTNNTCVFCGQATVRSPTPQTNRSHIDHAIPKSRGGNNTLGNAQNSCQTCNLQKGPRTTEEYMRYLRR